MKNELFTHVAVRNDPVAHECILDLRAFHSVTAEDVGRSA